MISGMQRMMGFALAAIGLSSPGAVIAAPTAVQTALAKAAELRGAEMLAYDQAAWHATDKFQEDLAAARISRETLSQMGAAGYVVEPSAEGGLLVTFFIQGDGAKWAYARYLYKDGQVSGEGILSDTADRTLSPLAERIAAARDRSFEEFGKQKYGLCSASPPNTLALPTGDDGALAVYILTSTVDAEVYPAGGHYRFDFDTAGNLIGSRRFMKTCFPLSLAKREGERVEMIFLTHILDPQPTEIHAFVSRNIPAALVVGTIENDAIWGVFNGEIRYLQDLDKAKK